MQFAPAIKGSALVFDFPPCFIEHDPGFPVSYVVRFVGFVSGSIGATQFPLWLRLFCVHPLLVSMAMAPEPMADKPALARTLKRRSPEQDPT
jgi:hypothetical protein